MSMLSYRPLLKAIYPMGALLVVAAVLDPVVRTYPFQPTVLSWRFGAVGLFSDSMVGVLFGLGWLVAGAAILQQRRALQLLSALTLAFGIGLAVIIGVFSLDALQIRAGAAPGFKPALDASVMKALLMMGLTVPVAIVAGVAGWKSSKQSLATAAAPRRATAMLLEHQREGVAVAGDRSSR